MAPAIWLPPGSCCLQAQIYTQCKQPNNLFLPKPYVHALPCIYSQGERGNGKLIRLRKALCSCRRFTCTDIFFMLFFHKHFPAAQDSNLCKIKNDLILVGSIPSCQYTFHVCQKTLNSTQLCTLLTEDYLYWMSQAWRLRRQADLPARLTEGISLVNTAAAFAFSNTQGSDLAWWMPGRDEEFVLGGGREESCSLLTPRQWYCCFLLLLVVSLRVLHLKC